MVKEYGYEYEAALNRSLWEKTAGKTTEQTLFGAVCLRSGRDALKAIAREYAPTVVLLPALACDSMVLPFEQYGHCVRFYKLNADYSIDLDSIQPSKELTLFLYMDYFGHPAITDATLNAMRAQGQFVFIEDRTHNLSCKRTSDFCPEYTIASLRKWLPIPDGGLLWGKTTKALGTDTAFSEKRLQAQGMRWEFLRCGDEAIKREYRQIFSTVSEIIDRDEPSAMSAYAHALAQDTDWNEVCAVRKRNAAVLTTILRMSPYVTLIQDDPEQSALYVPFTVPNRDEIQRRLSSEGIFNTIIWPLTDLQKQICGIAKLTEETMLAAPCDQRYSEVDMEQIGAEMIRVIADAQK